MRVLSLIIAVVLAVASPAPARAQDRYGTRVEALEADGAPDTILQGDFPIVAGSVLTREGVRAAIQAMYDRGGYSRIEVEARPVSDTSTALIFHLDDPYFFATVRVEPRGLMERPLSGYLTLPYGERFSRARLDAIVEEVGELLEAEGFFGAELGATYTQDVETRLVTSVIQVDVGPAARVGEVRFDGGEQTFSDGELRDAFGVDFGDRFLLENVRVGEDRLRTLFADVEGRAGFLGTRVEASHIWDPVTNTVDLEVAIEPGDYTFVDLRGFDLSDERLRELVPVFDEASYDEELIEDGRLNLLEYLQREGYFQAEVSAPPPIVVELDPEGPGEEIAVQIIYEVDPGARYIVAGINLTGNTYFNDTAIRSEIGLTPGGVFSRGTFSPELMAEAERTIGAMYASAGFRGTRVTATRTIERNSITVDIGIDEGQQLPVSSLEVRGQAALDAEEILRVGGVREGGIYRPLDLEAARRAIIARYHSLGYPDAAVRTTATPGTTGVDIVYDISEGPRYQIGRIVIAGQTRTRQGVISRYARPHIREGAPYDPEAVLETQRSLYAAGIFDRVDVVPLDQSRSGERDVLIHVEDAAPILLTYGVGVQERVELQGTGSAEGGNVDLRGTVELSHNNLWGLDRTISARVQGSRQEQRFQTTYREPQLFNWDVDGFASFFAERAQTPEYDATRLDFSLQTLYELRNEDNLLLSANFQSVSLQRLSQHANPDEGPVQIAMLGASWVRDRRDNPFNPSRGNYLSSSFRVGYRGYGSEFDFTSLFLQGMMFRPIRRAVLAGSIRFGWNRAFGERKDRGVPVTERFFAGGSTTLRAFDVDQVQPAGSLEDEVGGNALYLFNLEYRFPAPGPFDDLSGAVFYDTGTVFQELSDFSFGDFTHTAGVGLRYLTPVGPVRVDLGFNLNEQTGEGGHKFHFTLGHAF